MKKYLLTILIYYAFGSLNAQDISFGQYGNYNLTVTGYSDLQFGNVITGSGINSVDINNGIILSITGVKYLDVIVEVSGAQKLYLNGNVANSTDANKSIPFTMKAAYANNIGSPDVIYAKLIPVSSNYFLTQFPMLERQSLPPGPPPTPQSKDFNQSAVNETANLYLYGEIDVSNNNLNAGSYSSDITITINYD